MRFPGFPQWPVEVFQILGVLEVTFLMESVDYQNYDLAVVLIVDLKPRSKICCSMILAELLDKILLYSMLFFSSSLTLRANGNLRIEKE